MISSGWRSRGEGAGQQYGLEVALTSDVLLDSGETIG